MGDIKTNSQTNNILNNIPVFCQTIQDFFRSHQSSLNELKEFLKKNDYDVQLNVYSNELSCYNHFLREIDERIITQETSGMIRYTDFSTLKKRYPIVLSVYQDLMDFFNSFSIYKDKITVQELCYFLSIFCDNEKDPCIISNSIRNFSNYVHHHSPVKVPVNFGKMFTIINKTYRKKSFELPTDFSVEFLNCVSGKVIIIILQRKEDLEGVHINVEHEIYSLRNEHKNEKLKQIFDH